MKNLKKIIFAIIPFIISTSFAQISHTLTVKYKVEKLPFGLTQRVPKAMPTVAIALSGGGARGLSQIGVLKALHQAKIPINIIVGTSMGSIVGGLYAAGYSIDQLDSIAINTKWNNLLSSERETNRKDLFIDQKISEDKAIFALRLKGFTPILPTSLNSGEKISNYLNLLTFQAPIHVDSSFSDLKKRFLAVCTNLVDGKEVVINKGSLSQAMRASSSVSFYLSPVNYDSLTLVDGGLVDNIPISIARDNGGQYIIAVNTTSDLLSKENLSMPWEIANQIISIPMQKLNNSELKYANAIITPSIDEYNINDFNNIDTLIERGYLAALPQIPHIKMQIDSMFRNGFNIEKFYLKNVMITGNEPDAERPFIQKYSLMDSVSSYDIQEDIYKLYSTGNYKNIAAKILQYENHSTVDFVLEPNPEIKSISFKGVSVIPERVIRGKVDNLIGSFYSAKKVLDRAISIIEVYRSRGFSLAEIRNINFNQETGNLNIIIDEGKISSIKIIGNNYTNNTIITREVPIHSGDYFNYNNIALALTNLRSTNLFDDVYFDVRREDGKNDLLVYVSEKESSLLRVGFRIDNEKNAQLSLDLVDENLFGSGTELGILLFGGGRNRAFVLEHRSNRIFNTYLTYKINAYFKSDDEYHYVEVPSTNISRFEMTTDGQYRQIYYGGSVSVGTQVERFGNLIFEGKYQVDQVKNIDLSPVDPLRTTIVSIKASSTIDTQDKYPYPTKGMYLNTAYETAQAALGGQLGYTNINFDYKNYFTISNRSTFSPRLMMGFADKTLPLSEEYSLGGQESFFGMNQDEYRGRQIFLASLEYRYKFPFQIFFDTYFKARYDLGSIWQQQEEIRFKDFRHGIGVSLSFNTPIGPADFSLGRSFHFVKNLPGDPLSWGDFHFYFSIGYYY